MRRQLLGLTVAVQLVTSCSWFAVEAPPRHAGAAMYINCTESKAAPALDTVIAVAGSLLTGLSLLWAASCEDAGCGAAGLAIPVFAAPVIPFAFSARHGFHAASLCRRLHREFEGRHPEAFPFATTPGADSSSGRDRACRPIPGAPRGGTCPPGQRCREGMCRDI